jgi:hypothetical protein
VGCDKWSIGRARESKCLDSCFASFCLLLLILFFILSILFHIIIIIVVQLFQSASLSATDKTLKDKPNRRRRNKHQQTSIDLFRAASSTCSSVFCRRRSTQLSLFRSLSKCATNPFSSPSLVRSSPSVRPLLLSSRSDTLLRQ